MSIRLSLLALSTVVAFGPPGIKVERINDPATAPVRGAVFLITGRHHQDVTGFTVTGRAEGLTAGKRVVHPLTLTPTKSEGVFGVTQQWETGQPWVLVFTVTEGGHDSMGVAEAAVSIGSDGKVVGIDYPMGTIGSGTPWPRRVAPKEIAAALAAMSPRR